MDKQAHTRSIDAPEIVLVSIDTRWNKYQAEFERRQHEFSHDAVRSLRVATRRILALVQLLGVLNPHPRLQKLRRTFKDQLNDFDDLRDTQVMLAEISARVPEIPTLQPFQVHLQKGEQHLLRSTKKKFKQIQLGDITKWILKTRVTFADRPIENIPARMFQAADKAFLITQQRLGWIDTSNSATIHCVRLAFKKFRYLIEIIHPALENFPQETLKRMKSYQSAMGRIQDTEILLQTLADYTCSASDFDPKLALRFYEKRHADALSAYLQGMRELDTFWRAAPDQLFAWETLS